ncbi:MAG: MarR family winged helix-turn-helix transcriptional regulator [Pigmentiphaga sp.]
MSPRQHEETVNLDLNRFLPYRLYRLTGLMINSFRQIYGPEHDLSLSEWRVLATLAQFDGMTARAISVYSDMHKTKVSRAIKSIETRGWLIREANPHDQREELLHLTDLGLETYHSIAPSGIALERDLLDSLGDRKDAFLADLQKLESKLAERA